MSAQVKLKVSERVKKKREENKERVFIQFHSVLIKVKVGTR